MPSSCREDLRFISGCDHRLSTFVTSSEVSQGGINWFLSRPYVWAIAPGAEISCPLMAPSKGTTLDTPYIDVFGRRAGLGGNPYRYRCDENPDSRNPCISWLGARCQNRRPKIGAHKVSIASCLFRFSQKVENIGSENCDILNTTNRPNFSGQ